MYAARQLLELHERKALSQPMTPNMLTNHSEGFLAYQREQVRIWRSSYRANLTTKEMNDILAAHLQTLVILKKHPSCPKKPQPWPKGWSQSPRIFMPRPCKPPPKAAWRKHANAVRQSRTAIAHNGTGRRNEKGWRPSNTRRKRRPPRSGTRHTL